MLDIKFIRENLEKVNQAAKNKNREVDFSRLLVLDNERRKLITESEKVRAERNELARSKNQELRIRNKGKELKEQLKKLEEKLKSIEEEFKKLMLAVPNMPDESVPVGKDSSGNKEIKKWGEVPKFDFKPVDHITLGKKNDLFDLERGSKIVLFRSEE